MSFQLTPPTHSGIDHASFSTPNANLSTQVSKLVVIENYPEQLFTETWEFCTEFAGFFTYAWGMALTKISGLVFLHRVGRHAFGRTATRVIYADIVWTALGPLQLSVGALVQCEPLSALSTCWKTAETCWNLEYAVLAYVINILIGNIPIIVLPIIFTMRLQMKPRKKLFVYGVPFLTAV